MAITIIASIQLDYEMRWVDEHPWIAVAGSAHRTVGGGMVVHQRALPQSGRPITLKGSQSDGWQTVTTVSSLLSLATQTGVTFPVRLRDVVYTCRFRHEIDPSPVQFEYLRDTAPLTTQTVASTEFLHGTIYLEVV